MPLLREGRNRIAGLIVGAETCHWGTSGASIWVGSSTGAHSAASTWLTANGGVGATMETGFPSRSTNILQFRGIYSTAQANFQWEQWLINTATASGSGAPLNVAVQQALGVKTSAQSWQLTACVTITT
jgi:hypothetical protein